MPLNALENVNTYPSNVLAIPNMAIAAEPEKAPRIVGPKVNMQR